MNNALKVSQTQSIYNCIQNSTGNYEGILKHISLAEARRIALAASLEAEKRWKAAAASEAAFYSVVLEDDPGEGR